MIRLIYLDKFKRFRYSHFVLATFAYHSSPHVITKERGIYIKFIIPICITPNLFALKIIYKPVHKNKVMSGGCQHYTTYCTPRSRYDPGWPVITMVPRK